jgi:crossover junction endodeoxyribonuclease RuvC
MRILGIDQSLTSTGLVIIDSGTIDLVETLKPGPTRGYQRVQMILDRVKELALNCDEAAIEGPAMHARGRAVTAIFGLYGCLTQMLWAIGRDPWIVPPSVRARYATGAGNAGKDAVLASVIRRYNDDRILGNDSADALAIADVVARRLGEPINTVKHLPKTALDAVSKVLPPSERVDDTITALAARGHAEGGLEAEQPRQA